MTATTNTTADTPTAQAHDRAGRRSRRRFLVPLVVVVALAVAGGSAAVKPLTPAGASTDRPSHQARTVTTNVYIPDLWFELGQLPAREQADIVANLRPSVRAQLRALTESVAAVYEGQ